MPDPFKRSSADLTYCKSKLVFRVLSMPNIASVFKSEIARLTRKEVRSEVQGVQKASTSHRKQIAALKRHIHQLESALKSLHKATSSGPPHASAELAPARAIRFGAKSLKSQRSRLGLSAADIGLLIGTSAQAVYSWEAGKARPRAKHLQAIAALRTLGKKQAVAIVADRR
jgi:DNA-binding transcriptional regulator YiaG